MGDAIIKEFVQREPWRAGQGRPYNALDPCWEGKELKVCHGDIHWGKKWWFCKRCGYCSCWSNTLHYQAEHPTRSYNRNLAFFYRRRREQGLTQEEAQLQALHITGAALKLAAMLQPNELCRFIDVHLTPE